MKILVIGHASYDITFPLDGFPEENTKNRVNERVECGGGPASNAAYLLGKWGMDVSLVAIIGNDTYGNKIKQELDTAGVDTKYLEMRDDYKTTSSFIMANKSNGSRTILTYREKEKEIKKIDLEFIPDIILIDGQEYNLSKKILKKYPHAISIIDAGRPTDEIIELSKMVNYVVCSKDFAENVTKMNIDYDQPKTLLSLYKEMENIFSNHIVITLESNGALYKDQGKIKMMPSIEVEAIDSTGAGDIFHGAFTYGIANDMPIEDIIKMSNITGGLSVTKVGGRYSVPKLTEVKKILNESK